MITTGTYMVFVLKASSLRSVYSRWLLTSGVGKRDGAGGGGSIGVVCWWTCVCWCWWWCISVRRYGGGPTFNVRSCDARNLLSSSRRNRSAWSVTNIIIFCWISSMALKFMGQSTSKLQIYLWCQLTLYVGYAIQLEEWRVPTGKTRSQYNNCHRLQI